MGSASKEYFISSIQVWLFWNIQSSSRHLLLFFVESGAKRPDWLYSSTIVSPVLIIKCPPSCCLVVTGLVSGLFSCLNLSSLSLFAPAGPCVDHLQSWALLRRIPGLAGHSGYYRSDTPHTHAGFSHHVYLFPSWIFQDRKELRN